MDYLSDINELIMCYGDYDRDHWLWKIKVGKYEY